MPARSRWPPPPAGRPPSRVRNTTDGCCGPLPAWPGAAPTTRWPAPGAGGRRDRSGAGADPVFAARHGVRPGVRVTPLHIHERLIEALDGIGWRHGFEVSVLTGPAGGPAPANEGIWRSRTTRAGLGSRPGARCEPGRDVEAHAATVFAHIARPGGVASPRRPGRRDRRSRRRSGWALLHRGRPRAASRRPGPADRPRAVELHDRVLRLPAGRVGQSGGAGPLRAAGLSREPPLPSPGTA